MKKRLLALLTALAMVLSCASVMAETTTETTGTATVQGFGGDITVTVTLDGADIKDVQITGAGETEGIGSKIINEWPLAFVEYNGIVDTYTGATFAVKSTGGMNAAKTAYQDVNTFDEAAGIEKTLKSAEAYADNEAITALAATVKEQWEAWQANPEGYFDSTELFALDTLIGGKGLNDPELVNTLVNNSAAAIDYLDSIGIHLNNVAAFGGASVKRIHRPINDEGKVVSVGAYTVPLLEAACQGRDNLALLTDVTATKLLTNEAGAVVGVEAQGKSGNKVTVNAKAVILATGGFGANLDMVVQYKPDLAGFMTTNAAGIQGQGILMATEIGAATVDMEQIQIHPTVQADTASLITEGLRGDGAILVNANGERFIDEVGTRDVVSAAEIAQPDSFSWLVVDQKMVDASSVIQGYINRGLMLQGDTYEALAGELGIPADSGSAGFRGFGGNRACLVTRDPDAFQTLRSHPRHSPAGGSEGPPRKNPGGQCFRSPWSLPVPDGPKEPEEPLPPPRQPRGSTVPF